MLSTTQDRSDITPTNHRQSAIEDVRTGLGAEAIAEAIVDNLRYCQATVPEHAPHQDWYAALAQAVRDRMIRTETCISRVSMSQSTSTCARPRSFGC